ncbi:MAG TPA: YdeI/OmpD-associated family protein [Pyrinomonadaceae bacterium]|nr:YdeI/OmpD-associated family protein [Pyrinomonadaceae bacterium]
MPAKKFRVLLEKDEKSEATGIRIPFDVLKVYGTRARVPVRGTINGFPFRSSIFPMGGGHHYMVVNKATREGAKAKGGQIITVVMERDDEPRVITPPPDLARALKADREARAAWEKLSYTHQKEYAQAVEEAKRPETRARRIEKTISQLASGEKPR